MKGPGSLVDALSSRPRSHRWALTKPHSLGWLQVPLAGTPSGESSPSLGLSPDAARPAATRPMCPTTQHHLLINTSCQVQRLASVNTLLAAVTGTPRGACCLISSREGRWHWWRAEGEGCSLWVLAGLERCRMLREHLGGPAEGSSLLLG